MVTVDVCVVAYSNAYVCILVVLTILYIVTSGTADHCIASRSNHLLLSLTQASMNARSLKAFLAVLEPAKSCPPRAVRIDFAKESISWYTPREGKRLDHLS